MSETTKNIGCVLMAVLCIVLFVGFASFVTAIGAGLLGVFTTASIPGIVSFLVGAITLSIGIPFVLQFSFWLIVLIVGFISTFFGD